MANWKDKIDLSLKDHLERQLRETHENKEAILSSKDPKITQLWIAIANLSREIFEITLRLKYLERAMRDISKPKQSQTEEKTNPDIKKAMKKILTGKNTKKKKTIKKKKKTKKIKKK